MGEWAWRGLGVGWWAWPSAERKGKNRAFGDRSPIGNQNKGGREGRAFMTVCCHPIHPKPPTPQPRA